MLIPDVFQKLIHESSLLAPDFASFKRQESAFIFLNLFVLSCLLLLHTLFAQYFGEPPRILLVVLSVGFFLNILELFWLQSLTSLSSTRIVVLTWLTIALNMSLALSLASLSYRQDTQYFALLVSPVLQAAFRFSLRATAGVVSFSSVLELLWVWQYFRLHPPPQPAEFVEAATIALIYSAVGVLVWILVQHLRSKQTELERARERLLVEEKLAAVGRFSSAIAHEIRNPVAMISSALATALRHDEGSHERREMFEVATKESERLEKLTTDFLAYARPKPPAKATGDVADFLAYAAAVCGPHAAQRAVQIEEDFREGLACDIDAGLLQQALINLVMNAIEASPERSKVLVRGFRDNGIIRIDIENGNGPIPREAAQRIFEPFFTTKPSGTGLGLAIARNIVRGHGGELVLACNEGDTVRFSMTLPVGPEFAS
jgi:signal transduction histidine kinase